MRKSSKFATGLLAAALFTGVTPAISQAATPALQTVNDDGSVTLQIVTVNDIHGRIGAMTVPWAARIEEARKNNPDTLFIGAGDQQGASVFASAVANDEPIMDVLKALQPDALVSGNHEWDKGQDDVNRIQDYLGDDLLGANLYDANNEPVLKEYKIVEKAGLKIGIIGTLPPDLDKLVSADAIKGLHVGDDVEAMNRVASEINDQVDVIVAAFHNGSLTGEPEGATWDSARASDPLMKRIDTELSPDIDVVLNGHTHRVYNWIDTVEQTGAQRTVIETGEYMNNIGLVTLTYDPERKQVTSTKGEIIPRFATEADIPAELMADPVVQQVKEIKDAALEESAVLGQAVVGRISADITREGVAEDDTTFPGESALGNLITDIFASEGAAYGAQIGMGNAGGVRNDLLFNEDDPNLKDGDVTYSELQSVMPFTNNQWVVKLTGAQLKELVEEQFHEDGTYNHISFSSNFTYAYDPEAPVGNKVKALYFEGKPVDPEQTYSILTYAFLASGTTGFPVFQEALEKTDTTKIDLDMFKDAFAASISGDPIAPSFARRTVQVSGLPSDAVGAGASVAFSLGDLDLTSTGTPLAKSISGRLVSASGEATDLGTFAAADHAADIAFTVPQDAAGDYTIELTVADAGTVVRLPLTVTANAAKPTAPQQPGDTAKVPTTPQPTVSAWPNKDGKPAGEVTADRQGLARTGAEVAPLGLAAAVILGAGILLVARRPSRR